MATYRPSLASVLIDPSLVPHSVMTKSLRFIAVGLMLSAATVSGAEAAKTRAPNVLLILVDDLGYGELGCQGNPQIPTPHIDSIAKNGVRCTSGYVSASYCSPSRAGLLTGRYQTRFGHELNPVGMHNLNPKAGLPLSERTIADQLKSAGYATGIVGKWHLGGSEQFHPLNRGFDEFYGFLHEGHFFVPPPYEGVTSFLRRKVLPEGMGDRWRQGNIIYTSHMGYDEPPYDQHNPILRGRKPIVEPMYLTDALTREAIAFIDRNKANPFFLYLSYNAVHSPLQGADKYMRRFKHIENIHRRVFAAMLSNLDDSVGTVLNKLRAEGLEENTLIFFISDNGGPTRELTSSNLPLRGGKGNLYEGGIRVPFMVQWKNKLPAGVEYDLPVISTDVFATASAVAGAEVSKKRPMDSVNLLPYLTGKVPGQPHDVLYWRMQSKTALRLKDWKIVRNPSRGKNASPFELYNLANDTSESKNLADKEPDKLRELTRVWSSIDKQMIEPVWSRSRK